MKILIVNLAGVKVDENGSIRHFVKAGSRWPMTIGLSRSVDYYPFPFWLAYTTALLKRDTDCMVKGLDGVVWDMTADELLYKIKEEKPDLLVTELVALTEGDDLVFLEKVKREIGCKIVVCGSYVSAAAEKLLNNKPFIDFAAIGEYEITVRELAEFLSKNNGGSLFSINGLVCRDGLGTIKINKQRALVSDLDFLPFPDREDFPAGIYPDFAMYSPCINIISSRGCPAGCIFCTDRHVLFNSPQYRMRDPKKIVDEMEYCINNYGARQFYFDDQSFVVNKRHVIEICEELTRRNIHIPWTCMGDAMFVDYAALKAMSDAGCIGMKFGIESADPGILKTIGKPLNLEKVKKVVKWCRELGIETHATFCIGLPGETVDTIRKSIEFMQELDIDTAQVSKAVPYPGTPMYDWAVKNNYLVTMDLSRFDGMGGSIISYPDLSDRELDIWYRIFLRQVSRKKIARFLKEPYQSFSILKGLAGKKGFFSTARSVCTFLKRGL